MDNKLPTEWDLLNEIWQIINQQVEEEIMLSSDIQDVIEGHIESHTAVHTAALRERVKELEDALSDSLDKVSKGLYFLAGATLEKALKK